ncbi:MAG: hypothetical protein MUO72_14575 [Bacteroidales bacterium]|nr:hypothetical protein [Bacteroidales bacterium]
MKLVNTDWEEKNTGLKTCEIIFEKEDKYQLYLDANIEERYDFSVIKIPVGNLGLVHQMEDAGYRYLENQMIISFEVDQLGKVDLKWQRFLSGFSYFLITEGDQINSILKEVSNEMFENDRFSLDPFWAGRISSLRYVNWIKEMYDKRCTQFYIMKKNECDVGFFSLKTVTKQISSCPIAGIYKKYKSHGYFFPLAWFWLKESNRRGDKKLIATISANNKPIHSFLSKVFSFRVDETLIVMRKVIRGY